MDLLVSGGRALIDVLGLVNAFGSAINTVEGARNWWYRRELRKEFRDMLIQTMDPKLRREANSIARRYDLSLDRLLEYVGPELAAIFRNRARRRHQRSV